MESCHVFIHEPPFKIDMPKQSIALIIPLLLVVTPVSGAPSTWNEKTISDNLDLVAGWQLDHPAKRSRLHWTYGAFYSGLVQYGLANPDNRGLPALREQGNSSGWGTLKRRYHADDQAIAHAWLEMAMEDGRQAAAEKIKDVVDTVMDTPSSASLTFQTPGCQDRWSWADALFMAPPVYAKLAAYTGDMRYWDFMDREYRSTHDFLFDKKENLFFRDSRYFTVPASNGKKTFWSRGNGWVMAGLPLILEDMPENRSSRSFYIQLLKRMANSLKRCQSEDGTWHASLLNPEDPPLPEMSGTLMIVYGMMWGVNQGYLDADDYLPTIRKAWKAACDAVSKEGALGWVQPIADKPGQYSRHNTELYGTGAYLMAGGELKKWIIGQSHPRKKTVTVTNPLSAFRPHETVSLPWKSATTGDQERLRVFDVRHGRVIAHQLADTDGDGTADMLLFQSNFRSGATRRFWIMESSTLSPTAAQHVCRSRPVPERMDDFAWENDLVAHRIYGPAVSRPAPKGEGLVSSGTDVWCKKPGTAVIDEFYRRGDYHHNHGKGLDMYNVGRGRGCGGLAVFNENRAKVSGNWLQAATLYNGPVQTAFEVTYAPWDVGGGILASETRRMALDAGSRFTHVRSTLTFQNARGAKLSVGVGLDTGNRHNKYQRVKADRKAGFTAAWSLPRGENACFGTAVLVPWLPAGQATDGEGSSYWLRPAQKKISFDWYLGSVWSEASTIQTAEQWEEEVRRVAACLRNPLQVKISH